MVGNCGNVDAGVTMLRAVCTWFLLLLVKEWAKKGIKRWSWRETKANKQHWSTSIHLGVGTMETPTHNMEYANKTQDWRGMISKRCCMIEKIGEPLWFTNSWLQFQAILHNSVEGHKFWMKILAVVWLNTNCYDSYCIMEKIKIGYNRETVMHQFHIFFY